MSGAEIPATTTPVWKEVQDEPKLPKTLPSSEGGVRSESG